MRRKQTRASQTGRLEWIVERARDWVFLELRLIFLQVDGHGKEFVTIRFGSKWGDALKPGDVLPIVVLHQEGRPQWLGKATVLEVSKKPVSRLSQEEMRYNLGGQRLADIKSDIVRAYGLKKSQLDEGMVSVIWLRANI